MQAAYSPTVCPNFKLQTTAMGYWHRTSEGLYLFGKIRRTDWLPVDFGANKNDQEKRSALSESEESEEGDFEDYEPSEDEWDEWDMEVEEAYEEAGDEDFEDVSWKDLLKQARRNEDDLPKDEDNYDEPGDSDFDDAGWKQLLSNRRGVNEDLPDDDTSSELSANQAADGSNHSDDLYESEDEPPEMHKLAKAIMKETGASMTDLPE